MKKSAKSVRPAVTTTTTSAPAYSFKFDGELITLAPDVSALVTDCARLLGITPRQVLQKALTPERLKAGLVDFMARHGHALVEVNVPESLARRVEAARAQGATFQQLITPTK